jgi:hypothetical protein
MDTGFLSSFKQGDSLHISIWMVIYLPFSCIQLDFLGNRLDYCLLSHEFWRYNATGRSLSRPLAASTHIYVCTICPS